MKFTKEKPTNPGFYWALLYNEKIVLYVYEDLEELWISYFGYDWARKLSENNHILWGDKIEEPEVTND